MSKNVLALEDSAAQTLISEQKDSRTLPDFPPCSDHRGEAVQYLEESTVNVSPWVFNIAVRYLNQDPISKPAVIYEKDYLEGLSQIELDFTIAHECYHLTSGDAYRAYKYFEDHQKFQSRDDLQQIEDAADAYAARRLKEKFNYSRADVESIRPFITNMPPKDKAAARMEHILACYDAAAPAH